MVKFTTEPDGGRWNVAVYVDNPKRPARIAISVTSPVAALLVASGLAVAYEAGRGTDLGLDESAAAEISARLVSMLTMNDCGSTERGLNCEALLAYNLGRGERRP
jgi:hypothetical protein